MKIYDIVWEEQEISDRKAIKIIQHPALQRIKKIWISTYGYLFELKRNATRYEHCVGVYLLLMSRPPFFRQFCEAWQTY